MSFADLISALRNTSLPVKSKASKFSCFVTDTYDSLELGPDIFQFYDQGRIHAAQVKNEIKKLRTCYSRSFEKIGSNDPFHVHGAET